MRCDPELELLLEDQYARLRKMNPALRAMCDYLDALAIDHFGVDPLITSIYRTHDDPNTLHQNWRAVDFRVYHRERDGDHRELQIQEWNALLENVNQTFRYGRLISKPWASTVVGHLRVHWEGNRLGGKTHVHLQERGRKFWQ